MSAAIASYARDARHRWLTLALVIGAHLAVVALLLARHEARSVPVVAPAFALRLLPLAPPPVPPPSPPPKRHRPDAGGSPSTRPAPRPEHINVTVAPAPPLPLPGPATVVGLAPLAPPAPSSASLAGLGTRGDGRGIAGNGSGTGEGDGGGDRDPAWIHRVTNAELAPLLSPEMRARGVKVSLLLDCRVMIDTTVRDCRIARKRPRDIAIDDAVLGATRYMRMSPVVQRGVRLDGERVDIGWDIWLRGLPEQ